MEVQLDCVFFERNEGWIPADNQTTLNVHPLSQKLFDFKLNVLEIKNLNFELLTELSTTIHAAMKILLDQDDSNDSTGFNIINANDICNFCTLSIHYIEILKEIKIKSGTSVCSMTPQKIYLTMLQTCINSFGLLPSLSDWSSLHGKRKHEEILYDFLIYLEEQKEFIPLLLVPNEVKIHEEKALYFEKLLKSQPTNFDQLQEELILLMDYERGLKIEQDEERAFCVYYGHLIFHALISDSTSQS